MRECGNIGAALTHVQSQLLDYPTKTSQDIVPNDQDIRRLGQTSKLSIHKTKYITWTMPIRTGPRHDKRPLIGIVLTGHSLQDLVLEGLCQFIASLT